MQHHFDKHTHNGGRFCTCHGWTRAQCVEDLPQHEPLPLVGLNEIAMRAGVKKPSVAMWRLKQEQTYFPEPVARVGRADIWWWPDVEQWLLATGRETDAGLTWEEVNSSPSGDRNNQRFLQINAAVKDLERKRS